MKSKIIYENDAILICYKPAGLPAQTGSVGRADCVSELKNYLYAKQKKPGEPYLGVVHRLDQPVEGLLVFAKTRQAAQSLTAQLTGGLYSKRYYAVVDGLMPEAEFAGKEAKNTEKDMQWTELVHYLKKDASVNLAKIVGPQKPVAAKADKTAADTIKPDQTEAGIKEARLLYRVLERQEEQRISLIEVELKTGRFHQIRAQMSAHGYPLLGDAKYGTEASGQKSTALGVRNAALCAYCLELVHPESGKRIGFSCQPENPAFDLFKKFKSVINDNTMGRNKKYERE